MAEILVEILVEIDIESGSKYCSGCHCDEYYDGDKRYCDPFDKIIFHDNNGKDLRCAECISAEQKAKELK